MAYEVAFDDQADRQRRELLKTVRAELAACPRSRTSPRTRTQVRGMTRGCHQIFELAPDAYLFSNDPMHAVPWNPDWASHKVSDLADAAGVELNIKKLRHYTASQLLAARFDLQNTAARLGHGGGGATTLKMGAQAPLDRRHRGLLDA